MTSVTTPYMVQTPTLSLHEIADILWVKGEFEAYRALKAYIAERDALLKALDSE